MFKKDKTKETTKIILILIKMLFVLLSLDCVFVVVVVVVVIQSLTYLGLVQHWVTPTFGVTYSVTTML